jgi:CheY-like chemotaxis protein
VSPEPGAILVVDDDASVREGIRSLLESEGYAVATAADGAEAIEKLRASPVRLVLLDLAMPGVDGWQFLARRESETGFPRAPVVLLSGMQFIAMRPESRTSISKPIDPPASSTKFIGSAANGLIPGDTMRSSSSMPATFPEVSPRQDPLGIRPNLPGERRAIGESNARRPRGAPGPRREAAAAGCEAMAHRVVHGASALAAWRSTTRRSALPGLGEIALSTMRAPCGRGLPGGSGLGQVAVFTRLSTAGCPSAPTYAIPGDLAARHVGASASTAPRLPSLMKSTRAAAAVAPDLRLVAFQLGNGASACAIDRGRSVDTSMGFTPLEGLVMGTRSGDLDPALVAYLAGREGVPAAEIVARLNDRSGLAGVSGISRDAREVERAADAGDTRARLALDLFAYRARKYLGAYLAVLGRADAAPRRRRRHATIRAGDPRRPRAGLCLDSRNERHSATAMAISAENSNRHLGPRTSTGVHHRPTQSRYYEKG